MDQALWCRRTRRRISSPNLATLRRYAYRPQVGEMYAGAGEICMVCCYADAPS